MISHVLGKEQGYPHGSKMPGAFKTAEDMLKAFVCDYKPRSSKPEQGKVQELDLMLITFTDEEINKICLESGYNLTKDAFFYMAEYMNLKLGLRTGFKAVIYTINSSSLDIKTGLFFCPNPTDWPIGDEYQDLNTGPSQNEDLRPAVYHIKEYIHEFENQ